MKQNIITKFRTVTHGYKLKMTRSPSMPYYQQNCNDVVVVVVLLPRDITWAPIFQLSVQHLICLVLYVSFVYSLTSFAISLMFWALALLFNKSSNLLLCFLSIIGHSSIKCFSESTSA